MTVRVVVGLEPDADSAHVKKQLLSSGAGSVSVSEPTVLVATVPEGEAEKLMQRARAIEGVRYVEPDSLQSTF
jgi:hypothetical protein